MLTTPIEWTGAIYPFQRILLVMAHASALILMYKAGVFRRLFRRLEAVGQMAATNYVMQSIICTLVFFGYGLNWFGELQFYQLYFVVLAIWVLQIASQSNLVAGISLRSARVAVAEFDVPAPATIPPDRGCRPLDAVRSISVGSQSNRTSLRQFGLGKRVRTS